MLVVDACVAVRWFLDAPPVPAARQLLAAEEELIAPDLILAEVGRAAWRLARSGVLSVAQATELIELLPHAFAHLVPVATLLPRALQLALALDQPLEACCYLALAEQRDTAVVTTDSRLAAAVGASPLAQRVRLIPLAAALESEGVSPPVC